MTNGTFQRQWKQNNIDVNEHNNNNNNNNDDDDDDDDDDNNNNFIYPAKMNQLV